MSTIKVGDKAPDFSLKNQNGNEVKLYDLLKEKHVVLYFYPKNETMTCTKEACSFRDQYEDFQEAGAEVIGVSADSVKSHQDFTSNRRLPFVLLSDPDFEVHKLYGAGPAFFGLLRSRITYLIDKEGLIRSAFNSRWTAENHVSEVLKVLNFLTLA